MLDGVLLDFIGSLSVRESAKSLHVQNFDKSWMCLGFAECFPARMSKKNLTKTNRNFGTYLK